MPSRVCSFFRSILSLLSKFAIKRQKGVSAQAVSLVSKLDGIYVEEIMVERSKIVAVDLATKSEQLVKIFSDVAHSRTPVFDGNLDKIVGFVHIKDVLTRVGTSFDIAGILRKIIYVPPSMKVSGLLLKMKVAHVHVAVVVDEFGATVGIVTMTDVVEQILGDIQDEHDINPEPFFLRVSSHEFEVSARIEVKEFLDKSGLELEGGDSCRTLGGYIFSIAGKVPAVGDVILSPEGVKFTILDADKKKIGAVLVDASQFSK